MRLPSITAALVAVACLAGARSADAASGRVVFSCGSDLANLCAISPDGTGRTQLTTDGAGSDKYFSPSLSSDGTKLLFLRFGKASVASFDGLAIGATIAGPLGANNTWLVARMRGDGQQVVLGQFDSSVCVFAVDLSGRNCVGGQSGSFGWSGTDVLSQVTRTNLPNGICLLVNAPPNNGVPGCDADVLGDPAYDLSDPTVSPDGRFIAVTRSTPGQLYGHIAIYDAAAHTLVREISAGPDAYPAWAPDSTALVFTRQGGGIYTAAVDGAPGQERQLAADARDATWGAGSGPAGSTPAPSGTGTTGGGGTPGAGTGGTKTTPPIPTTCTVPKLVGLSLTSAKHKLSKAGCAAPSVTTQRSTAAHRGKVLTQGQKAKKVIAATKKVKLVVGR